MPDLRGGGSLSRFLQFSLLAGDRMVDRPDGNYDLALEIGAESLAVALEPSLDDVVRRAVDDIWRQVPAYAGSDDGELRDNVTAHVGSVFRTVLATISEGRPASRPDFAPSAEQARRRVGQGVSLSDFLQAFRIGQLNLWQGLLAVSKQRPGSGDTALSLVAHVMQVIEVGSSVAAEAYLAAQQYQLAEYDRVRRDLLEDLLARRDCSSGVRQSILRASGLGPSTRLIALSAAPVQQLPGERTLGDVVAAVQLAAGPGFQGLTVVRHDEIVGIAPVPTRGVRPLVDVHERTVEQLERQGIRLSIGVSTVYSGLAEAPEAYAEACVARDGLNGRTGVLALPMLSSLDYLMLRDDGTARRLIHPELRRFVEEDQSAGGYMVATLLEYAASDLNAKVAAERLHVHVNTAYYRLDRIAARTGRDMRKLADIQELLIAIRLLLGRRPERISPDSL
ncbi:PucR family transcriptional regulator [Pseudonocardia sp. UM4_GMWB1]|uniref:PucR family transcriptional regulator n=1 Tax=Pseudonocardia sp. UM4_GMWB1 TaxID=2212989 RepID=UPI00307DA76D